MRSALLLDPPRAPWTRLQRAAFRLVFAYLVLYAFPFPIGLLPGTEWLAERYSKLWDAIVPRVGANVLGIQGKILLELTGSGDRTYDYILCFCFVSLAIAAALLWSALDRRREYATLHAWLRVAVRFLLGFTMLTYGFIKIFKSQFPLPSPIRLLTPYGDSSPMALLWTFMGYSTPYTIFTGAAEALGGTLLFFRRTTTLGALVTAAVLTNVVMLNFCYDVPVKIYSTHLLLASLFLLLPDARRLANVFVLHRPAKPPALGALFASPRLNRAAMAAKLLFVGFLFYTTISSAYEGMTKYGDLAPKHPLYGVYEVESFSERGEVIPPLLTASARWRKVGVSNNGRLSIKRMDDAMQHFRLTLNAEEGKLTLKDLADPSREDVLAYSRPDDDHITLEGSFAGAPIAVRLRRVELSGFLLLNRDFRWISEAPFNK